MPSETTYKGIPVSPGISIGKAYLYTRSTFEVDTEFISNGEVAKELDEFSKALELSVKELKKIRSLSHEKIGKKNSLIFDAQLEILDDKFFITGVINRIRNEKRTASFIFDEEMSKIENALLSANDEYLKERVADIKDVRNRVLRNMKKKSLFRKLRNTLLL